MRISIIGTIVIAISLTGCASAPTTLHYAPSSTMTIDGELKVGDFKYLPGEQNADIEPNQIRNTALLENIILDKNVDKYFETALFTESRFVGIKVKDSTNVVSGEIIEFLIDDLGYSIDWTLEVKYIVTQNTNYECYSKVFKIEKNTSKFTNVFGTLNEIMKLNIEKVFQDSSFVECVSNKS